MALPRTKLTPKQIGFLHVVVKKNDLRDDDYRMLLQDAAGVTSSKDLDQAGLDRVLDLLEDLGYDTCDRKRRDRRPAIRNRRPTPKGRISHPQNEYIEDLAAKVFGQSQGAFSHWLEHFHKVSHPRFLSTDAAGRVIESLKSMASRGYRAKGGRS